MMRAVAVCLTLLALLGLSGMSSASLILQVYDFVTTDSLLTTTAGRVF